MDSIIQNMHHIVKKFYKGFEEGIGKDKKNGDPRLPGGLALKVESKKKKN